MTTQRHLTSNCCHLAHTFPGKQPKDLTKLIVGVVRTDVVAGTEQPFHDEWPSHGIKEAKVLRDPIILKDCTVLVSIQLWVKSNTFTEPVYSWTLCAKLGNFNLPKIESFIHSPLYLINLIVDFHRLVVVVVPSGTYSYEKDPKEDVSDVGEDMVEVAQWAKGMGTPKIVETQILIPSLIQHLGEWWDFK